jgi:putative two-component system response regulator
MRVSKEALALAAEKEFDLILMDALMPDMDGFETVTKLKAHPATQPVPVIMITALEDRDSKLRALEAGAEEFLSKPIDLSDITVRVRNLLRLKDYSDFLKELNRILEEKVADRTFQLEDSYRETLLALVRAAEFEDQETGSHVRRIGDYCRSLAQALALPSDFADAIYVSSPMHDIGKIGIPDHILLTPGELTSEECAVMKTHSALGARILDFGRSPYSRMGAEIALNHHERWDGSGYPAGRKGEEIPVSARITQICDVDDALRSMRPYKPAIDHLHAVKAISQGDGRTRPSHFEPKVLACFLRQANQFEEMYARCTDG